MGKPGKKAGKGLLPPTNINRQVSASQRHLRDQRTIKRLKMYKSSKIVHDKQGRIVKGSVLSASDKVEQSAARIAPDRRWFGNTHVISQDALQKFRAEMKAKYKDPYSVVLRQSKLPLSLLMEPKPNVPKNNALEWNKTFGKQSTRKRVRLPVASVEEMAAKAQDHVASWIQKREMKPAAEDESGIRSAVEHRKLFKKGQSHRIWNELYKVIDSSDVVLYVLDARDPMGTRSKFLEDYMRREKAYKHFVFILNKCDLIPLWAAARWLQLLSTEFPTIAFHASVEHPFGKGNLISLLRQFSRLHNVTHRGNQRTKSAISVGIVGYPNVGKSSVINTLRRKQVCKVAPIPGETKVWQYVALTRSIFLIDCPGIIYDAETNNEVEAVLKGVVRVERLGDSDKTDVVAQVLKEVQHKDLVTAYGIERWSSAEDFCAQLATLRGKLFRNAVPNAEAGARTVLYDWQRGKIPWFRRPPFDSDKQQGEATAKNEGAQREQIEQLNSLCIENVEIMRTAKKAPRAKKSRKRSASGEPDDEAPAQLTTTAAVTENAVEEDAPKPKRRRRETKSAAQPKPQTSEEDLWNQFLQSSKR